MRFELPEGKFVIPSGILASTPDTVSRIAGSADDIGVITTKSIGLLEREGYKEPIIAGVGGSIVNAVGLSNPGASEFLKEISGVYPALARQGKILMTSIFGGGPEEFARLASLVEGHSDWIELNLSCPHAEGYGAAIGTCPDAVEKVVSAAREATDLPIFAKIVPDRGLSGIIAKVSMGAGADGITAVNTLGPLAFRDPACCRPLLSNIVGGLSGPALKEIALGCVKEVRKSVGPNVPIIGMGGISDAADVEEFRNAGATLFGVGTALQGLRTSGLKRFFDDLRLNRESAERKPLPIQYYSAHVDEAWGTSSGRVLVFDSSIKADPGQFVSVWVPGVGEKPFSLALDKPMMLLVKEMGKVSGKVASLGEGDEVMVRGPYGNSYAPSCTACLVGGGTGVAPVHFIASRYGSVVCKAFIGGGCATDLPLYDSLCELVDVSVSTVDGSLKQSGLVTEIMELDGFSGHEFFNCGPEKMLVKAAEIESKATDASKIFCAVERYTKCGMGLCGSCAMDGYRTCVDGPVFTYEQLRAGRDFGNCKRTASGRLVRI
jgi:dihydroorotate dehydrogenase (NAD+) catalytic subunit